MLTNTERQAIVEEVNAGTYGIDEALDDIAAAQKGEEVRKALYAEALVLNREGHAGSTDMIARQQIANLQTSVNGQISTLRTEVGEDIDDLETALNNGLATQNGKIAAQDATIANVVANYNVEYGSTELWASTGETGALAAGTTVTLSEDVSHFDYIDIYSFCGNNNILDTLPVDSKLQSTQGYATRWVNLSDPGSGSYKAYVRIIETRLHIIGTTLTIDHQVTYRNGEEVNISGAEITQSNRSTYVGEFGIMKVVGRKITANTEIEDVRIGADGTEYASAGQAVRAQVNDLYDAIPAIDDGLDTAGAAADAAAVGNAIATIRNGGSGLSNEAKQALLALLEKVAYIDGNGQTYYNALENALYPPANLASISAVYTQSGAVYTTDSLDTLKPDLVVTATYDDSTSAIVTAYTLSGTLTAGTSTVTVAYGEKTTTFNVTVTAAAAENFVKVNSPVINNRVLEKSSINTGYIRTNEVFNPGSSTWNIKFKFKKISASGASVYQDLIDTVDASNTHIRSLLYEFQNDSLKAYLATLDAADWNIDSGRWITQNVATNTDYYFDAYFDGSYYGFKISTDGTTWTDAKLNSTNLIAGGGYLAFGRAINGEFNGEIDLSTLEVWIDGEQWWVAYGELRTVSSISAVYTQSGNVYATTPLDNLKTDLVVTATYNDQTTATITNYTLSGTLTEGTSTITVACGEKTTTFNVTVTEATVLTGYTEVGSPTITNNILTVGDGQFIKCNQPFSPSADTWEVIVKYRKTSTLNSYSDIVGTVDSSNASARGFLFELNNTSGTAGAMFISSNGTAWDITASQSINDLPDPASWVWLSMGFDGSNYITKTSTDGETWTTRKTIASANTVYDDSYAVGFGLKRNGYFKGEIDLTGCEIYKDGALWWKAVA